MTCSRDTSKNRRLAPCRSQAAAWAVALLLCAVGTVVAQEPSQPGLASRIGAVPTIQTAVSKESVQVAEPFTLQLTVTAAAGTQVSFPPSVDKLGPFDVIEYRDQFDVPAQPPEGQNQKSLDSTHATASLRIWTRRWTLETIETGQLEIPALNVSISPPFESTDREAVSVLTSQPISILVPSVLEERPDPTRFRDIKSVVDLEVSANEPSSTLPWWIAGGASLMLLALVATLWLARRSRLITPLDWFVRELEKLKQSIANEVPPQLQATPQQATPHQTTPQQTTPQQTSSQQAASQQTSSQQAASQQMSVAAEAGMGELSHLMRRYLELQFGTVATAKTSQELLRGMEDAELLPAAFIERYRQLLEECELVLFAALPVTASEAIQACEDAISLVRATASLAGEARRSTTRLQSAGEREIDKSQGNPLHKEPT